MRKCLKIDIDMNSGNSVSKPGYVPKTRHELKSSKCFKIGIYRNEPSVSFGTNIPLRNLFQLLVSVISHCIFYCILYIVYFLENFFNGKTTFAELKEICEQICKRIMKSI